MTLFSSAREFGRLRELIAILLKYGFDDIVRWLQMEGRIGWLRRWVRQDLPPEIRRLPSEARARLALEEMGPTFVKLGQILATRVDLLPSEWIAQLEKLQDQATAIPFAQLKPQLERSLGAKVSACFREIDETPVGTASMAQVYRAVTPLGQEVVLKIRRPGIEEKIQADLRLLKKLAEIAEAQSPELRRYRPLEVMLEFETSLLSELDFSIEARTADRLRDNLRQFDWLVIPRIYWEWTCDDLNVQEFIRGIPAKDVEAIDAAGLDRRQLARRGARAVWKMMLEDGLFHADPHPGNFLVLPGGRIAMLDYGMVGRLTATRRDQLIRLIRGVALQEPDTVTQVLVEWAAGRYVNREGLLAEVTNLIERYDGIPLPELDISDLLNAIAGILRNYSLRLPSELTLLAKACVTLEGFGRLIDPDFQLMEEAMPLLRKTLANRYSPKVLARAVRSRALDAVERLYHPGTMPASNGNGGGGYSGPPPLQVEELTRLVNRLERASHRQARAVLLAGLFLVSGMMLQLEDGPHILGMHVIGLLSLLGCTGYWLWMLTQLWWSERGHRD
ncbi:ABC1 kinase family protein [Perlucidibaca piscinae]|uniref:ABC1 kinase family protein n=1 Tax=Perlucidibaca piscinae TaxID=392589 RepID=UPI0003B773A8|nr:AarF/UbiB family protein [Perlucidibaca piscinae]